MNIKSKANLHFKLFPVIYEENQYACTISAAKSYIGKLLYLSFILIGLVGTAAFLFFTAICCIKELYVDMLLIHLVMGLFVFFVLIFLLSLGYFVDELDNVRVRCCIYRYEDNKMVFRTVIKFTLLKWKDVVKYKKFPEFLNTVLKNMAI